MKDKYMLTKEENIFLAKKLLVKNIYNSAKIEGLNITFPQTQTLLDGVNVSGLPLDEIECVLNLRNAWKFVLANSDKELTLNLICNINHHVSMNESLDWGKLRKGEVGVSGTDNKPKIPNTEDVEKNLNKILTSSASNTQKAIDIFTFIVYNQLFWDGNKRTATIAANQFMINKGVGVLSINDSHLEEFNNRLHDLYDNGNEKAFKNFLYSNCILGLVR